jgi:hypothetical protein
MAGRASPGRQIGVCIHRSDSGHRGKKPACLGLGLLRVAGTPSQPAGLVAAVNIGNTHASGQSTCSRRSSE